MQKYIYKAFVSLS